MRRRSPCARPTVGHRRIPLACLLFRLGLYGPTPERVDDLCAAMFFDADPEDGGWLQCGKLPGHIRRGDPLHEGRWSGRCWRDDHRQAVADDEQG